MRVRHGLVAAVTTAAVTTAAVAAAALLVAGCGGSSPAASSGSGSKVIVMAKSLPGVGTVLVNAKGYVLYMFVRDGQKQVTCTSLCAATWPPLRVSPRDVLAAGAGVKSSLLGSDPDPAGGRVVTYNGWPLYTYTGDVQAGQSTGQGIDLNGGEWFVMRPSGQPFMSQPS
jgi:predicted lipoprotein with Yx(FWY)xxD motif